MLDTGITTIRIKGLDRDRKLENRKKMKMSGKGTLKLWRHLQEKWQEKYSEPETSTR